MISSFVHRTSHYQATRNISVTHLRIIITITSDCGLNQVVKSYCTIMADKDLKTNKNVLRIIDSLDDEILQNLMANAVILAKEDPKFKDYFSRRERRRNAMAK